MKLNKLFLKRRELTQARFDVLQESLSVRTRVIFYTYIHILYIHTYMYMLGFPSG